MDFTDYYQTLGVARDATPAQVKTAYRALARTLHPDVNKDLEAQARFKRVNEAYEVLRDQEKRAKYDRLGANWQEIERQEEALRRHRRTATGTATASPESHSDFFETFFGGGGIDLDDLFTRARGGAGGAPRPRRGRDLEQEIQVTLEEAVHGGVRLLALGNRTVEVRIPAGVTEGSVVRVAGEGGGGAGGGSRGDILLRVRLRPHPRFTVRDRDLATDLQVRDDQAVLGDAVSVEGPAGPLQITVPPASQAGRVLRLRGKGLPGLRGGRGGDLLLTLRVTVPAAPDPEELDLYRRLAEHRKG